MFLDLKDIAITVLPVLLDADSDQWELISQEIDELRRTINSCLLKHQKTKSRTTQSAADADNPIAQIIRCSTPESTIGSAVLSHSATRQSAKRSDIKYEWDGKVLLLRPSADQWNDFPALLSYARELDV